MLIVIEGLDGSGKSTQVRMLAAYLKSRVDTFEYVHFPRYDAPVYGELIGKFLKGDFGSKESVHPQLVALLFALDRQDARNEMMSVLENDGVVLLDRYVYSNIAYQCAKLNDQAQRAYLRDWILRTEFEKYALPHPDLNIFLDVPISFVESRLESQRQGADRSYLDGGSDIHETDISFQQRVRQEYLSLCEDDKRLVKVDCSDEAGQMLPAQVIARIIKEKVDSFYSISGK